LTFKNKVDWERWRAGWGSQQVRSWITLFNALSECYTGKSAVVTSWWRGDKSFHQSGLAVDFRRLSAANRNHPQYTERDVTVLERAAVRQGIPVVVVSRGKDNEHWHCGDLAVKG